MESLKVGDWIETGEGIAQLLDVVETFVEEFSPAYRAGQALGDYVDTLVVYKILCAHDGTIRKRQLVTYSVRSGVSEAGADSLRIVEVIKAESPEQYQRFVDFSPKRPLEHNYTVWLNVPEEIVDDLAEHANEFAETHTGTFTYDELFASLLNKAPSLDVESVHREYSRTSRNLRLVLNNPNLTRLGKRALLAGVGASIR